MLTIVAKITSKPGNEEIVQSELQKLIEPTRKESGCVQYDLHRSIENRRIFLFYENWQTKSEWNAHMESRHLKAFLDATEDQVENLELMQMEKLG